MAKYILHGGVTKGELIQDHRFFNEILKDTPLESKLLLVYLAKPENVWPELLEQDKINFTEANPFKKIEFIVASTSTDTLIDQIKSSDAIYLSGGNSLVLRRYLAKIPDLKKLFWSKVVAGSSAGANVLADYFYSNTRKRVDRGLGLLPVKIICHYSPSQSSELSQLREYRGSPRVITLPEQTFVILDG